MKGQGQYSQSAQSGEHGLALSKRECYQVENTSCQEGSTSLILEQPSCSLFSSKQKQTLAMFSFPLVKSFQEY